MVYKLLHTNEFGQTIYARFDDDGLCRLTCTADYPEFQAWLEESNAPIGADTPIPSDSVADDNN
jgi:hypothetical protein